MIPKRSCGFNYSCCQSDVQKEGNWFWFLGSIVSLSQSNLMEQESFHCFWKENAFFKKNKESLAWRIKLKLSAVGRCPNYFFNSWYCQTCLSCTRCSLKQRLCFFLFIYLRTADVGFDILSSSTRLLSLLPGSLFWITFRPSLCRRCITIVLILLQRRHRFNIVGAHGCH